MCLFQSWWQNFYWLWRNQNQSLFPYNSVNFGLKNTYSTTRFIWRKLQNPAPCRRSVRLVRTILYHQRQVNLLGKKRQVTCMEIAFIFCLYFQLLASKPQKYQGVQFVCTDCLFYMYSWCVSKVSGYGYFKGCPEFECFFPRKCSLQTLEIMLWCWCWEVWGNLPNNIHFFWQFWLSCCNEVLYQQCTVSV